MPIRSNVYKNITTTEFQKFVEIYDDSRFPAITTNPVNYYNESPPQVFPKYALLTYDITQSVTPPAVLPTNTLPFGDNAAIDAFGRLRTAVPDTIHNCKQVFDNAPLLYNSATVGGGVNTYDSSNSCTVMSVTNTGDAAIRQTRLYANYQPGKSQLALMTFVMPQSSGLVSRVGLFTGDTTTPYANPHGFYLENNDGNLSFNINNYGGGATSQTIPQSAWNIDTLNGSGPSKLTLDVSKTQILVIDFEWLGVGRVRFGFCVNGIIFYAHAFNNANNLTLPYLKNPNNPVRYEIRSIGGAGTLLQICSTVMAEGGSQENGIPFSCNTGVSATPATNFGANVEVPLLNIRLKSNYLGATINLKDLSVMATSTTNSRAQVVLNGTVGGTALTWVSIPNSCIEYAVAVANNTITGGTTLFTTYFNKNSNPSGAFEQSLFAIGSNIDGTRDVLSLTVNHPTGNEQYYGSLTWLELV